MHCAIFNIVLVRDTTKEKSSVGTILHHAHFSLSNRRGTNKCPLGQAETLEYSFRESSMYGVILTESDEINEDQSSYMRKGGAALVLVR